MCTGCVKMCFHLASNRKSGDSIQLLSLDQLDILSLQLPQLDSSSANVIGGVSTAVTPGILGYPRDAYKSSEDCWDPVQFGIMLVRLRLRIPMAADEQPPMWYHYIRGNIVVIKWRKLCWRELTGISVLLIPKHTRKTA